MFLYNINIELVAKAGINCVAYWKCVKSFSLKALHSRHRRRSRSQRRLLRTARLAASHFVLG